MKATAVCLVCEDTGWVCKNHRGRPGQGPHGFPGGGAGAPSPACNRSMRDEPPRLPKGFERMRIADVCNLYSITTNQEAIRALFRKVDRYVGNLAAWRVPTPPMEDFECRKRRSSTSTE